MSDKYIAVDAGRKKIKSAIYIEKDDKFKYFDFDSKYVFVDFNRIKNIAILDFNKDVDLICKIDDQPIMAFGAICNRIAPPEDIKFVTNDTVYVDYSILYTVLACAKFCDDGDNISLAINLTANNINLKDDIKAKLIGKHKVTFFNNVGKILKNVTITVGERVGVYFQGWISYMDLAIGDDFKLDVKYAKQDSIIIDIGMKTVDVSFIRELSTVKQKAYDDCASEKFFKYIKDILYSEYNKHKSITEIEYTIYNNKPLKIDGVSIDLNSIILKAKEKLANDILVNIQDDFSEYTPEKRYLTGGGVYLFKDIYKMIYPDIELFEDPTYSNVRGLIKLLVRRLAKNLKGSENA